VALGPLGQDLLVPHLLDPGDDDADVLHAGDGPGAEDGDEVLLDAVAVVVRVPVGEPLRPLLHERLHARGLDRGLDADLPLRHALPGSREELARLGLRQRAGEDAVLPLAVRILEAGDPSGLVARAAVEDRPHLPPPTEKSRMVWCRLGADRRGKELTTLRPQR